MKVVAYMFCSLAMAGVCTSVSADVWQDCTAWYIGGGSTVGDFQNGDMTDLRHAAIANSPTHGGAYRGNALGISNLCENVYSAASGRTFENQRTIYLAQRDGTFSGTYKVYENGVTLPFAATNSNYTLLMRVKLDDVQPHNRDWVHVTDLGYSGGTYKYAFAIRYLSATEQLGFGFNNGIGKKYFSPTNDVCTTLRGKWLELSVSLEMRSQTDAKDNCRMRVGVAAEGLDRSYYSYDFEFPKGQSIPRAGKMYLAGVTGNGNAGTECAAARGSYQMVSYWERVLTDDEILEAFRLQGPDGTPEQEPALLKVGDPAWGADVFHGTIAGTSATPSLDLQDLDKVPSQIAAGQSLDFPFTVPNTCTNLRQLVRLSAAAGSCAADVQVKLDGNELDTVKVVPGGTVCVEVEAARLAEGAHTLGIVRSDAGSDPLMLTGVEISGSWRLGWIDESVTPFQSDTASGKSVLTNAVEDLTTNGWGAIRGTIKSTRHTAIAFRLANEDVATRRVLLRAKPFQMPGATYDCVVSVNGVDVYTRTVSDQLPYSEGRFDPIVLQFEPNYLRDGENVVTFATTAPTVGTSSWLRFDYFELEVGKRPKPMRLIVR